MKIACILVLICLLPFADVGEAQVRQPVSTPDADSRDFGSKFFEDLRSLFGRLQQSELQQAFQRAQPAHCSDLVEQKGEWKQVAFLNDDRSLGDWHFDNIDQVKRDLTSFVFSGICRSDEAPVKVSTSFPVQDGSSIKDNAPVSVMFDAMTRAYVFELPFLYLESRNSDGNVYTTDAPHATSQIDPTVAEEFRCKALGDAELTYRFLLCRTHVINRDQPAPRQYDKQPLGNAAYYILSDGKEATSSVKFTFDPVDAANGAALSQTAPPGFASAHGAWALAEARERLMDVGDGEFRLRFNPEMWAGRIDKPQVLSDHTITDLMKAATPDRGQQYCIWLPNSGTEALKLLGRIDDVIYSLSFRKDLRSSTSAVIELESGRMKVGTMSCFFPEQETPMEIRVLNLISIAGDSLAIEIRR